MASYSWVSVTALAAYLFLLLAFSVARKSKVINSFIMLLSCMILAAGGSFFMRIQAWPSVNFWHYVSLLGIMMVPAVFYRFFVDFLDDRHQQGRIFWVVVFGIAYLVNLFTQWFIPTPEVITDAAGHTRFVYHYEAQVVVLLLGAVCVMVQCVRLFLRYCRGDALVLRQLSPILLGLGVLVLGTCLSTVPFLRGIPLDIISSVVFAYLLFYALYRKRLFKLSLLASPVSCYLASIGVSFVLVYFYVAPLRPIIMQALNLSDTAAVMIIALILIAMIYVLYLGVKALLSSMFVRDEQSRADCIQRFSYSVSKTLDKSEILTELLDTIREMVSTDMAYVCLKDKKGRFVAEKCMSDLHKDNFVLKSDHPLAWFLETHDGAITMDEFTHTKEYISMWESEKKQLSDKKIVCAVPLKDEAELIGMVLLSAKQKDKRYTNDDLSLLTSLCSVSSMAVKNSEMYEKAYLEARKDELTDLFNRKSFYETASALFNRDGEHAVALAYLNVDDFKLYNQLYGDSEGDLALKRIAGIIRASSEGHGQAFRMAGKEFALLLPDYDLYSAKVLVESIAEQVRNMQSEDRQYNLKMLTMSCGICAAPFMASTLEELINNTDFAVYTAKRAGKNKVVIYSQTVEEQKEEPVHTSGYDEYASTIVALTATIDTKDHYTFRHSQNVANYASALARACGMNSEFVEIVREAGLLHDIGKIGVREDILNKPLKLTPDEYEVMKTHVENSVGIIRHLPSLNYVIPAVISHHERYDGKGYPRGIAGENIPLMGRMLCVADSFDAMVSRRSYKKAMSVSRALEILQECSGGQFDPHLVTVFTGLVRSGEITVPQDTSDCFPNP